MFGKKDLLGRVSELERKVAFETNYSTNQFRKLNGLLFYMRMSGLLPKVPVLRSGKYYCPICTQEVSVNISPVRDETAEKEAVGAYMSYLTYDYPQIGNEEKFVCASDSCFWISEVRQTGFPPKKKQGVERTKKLSYKQALWSDIKEEE
jgi:hypothetical protein